MKNNYKKISLEIKESEICFPKGYFFKQSPVQKFLKIESAHISEINLNTNPPSLVYQENEIVFLKVEYKIILEEFAARNNIPIVERFDIWEHINRPYLDTEFEEHEKLESEQLLAKNGIDTLELKQIRKKAGRTMSLNFIAWEWAYLGLFDYLNWTFLTKKKYWWAMEIALRNYNKNVTSQLS